MVMMPNILRNKQGSIQFYITKNTLFGLQYKCGTPILFTIFFMSAQQGSNQCARWQEGKESHEKGLLMVVGRTGHGKSAFVRMIVSATEQSRISEAMQRKETGCQTYNSDRFADFLGGDIDIMDTPDVQSLESALTAVEAVDEALIRRRGPIVGIAVVLDVQQREVSQDGKGFLLLYLQLLKLRENAKRALLFCVLTKFDRYYQDTETNQTLFAQFESLFREKGLLELWERKILWMSEPNLGKSAFEKKVKGEPKQMYSDQYALLTHNIRSIWEKNPYISCEEFQQSYHVFFLRNLRIVLLDNTNLQDYVKAVVKAEAQTLTSFITAIIIAIYLIIGGLLGSILTGAAINGILLGIYTVQEISKNYQGQLEFEKKIARIKNPNAGSSQITNE